MSPRPLLKCVEESTHFRQCVGVADLRSPFDAEVKYPGGFVDFTVAGQELAFLKEGGHVTRVELLNLVERLAGTGEIVQFGEFERTAVV